jgi:hypothetical protein
MLSELDAWLLMHSERDAAISSARHCLALARDTSLRPGFRRTLLAQAATYRRIAQRTTDDA